MNLEANGIGNRGRLMKRLILVCIPLLLAMPAAWADIGGREITFRPQGASPVTFSHEFHVIKKKSSCSQCHSAIFVPKVSSFATSMNEMYKGRSCGACHNGQRAFAVQGNCQKCHAG